MDPSRLGLLSNGLPSAVASTPRPAPPLQRETEVTETPIINSIEMGAAYIEKMARSTAMVVSVNHSTCPSNETLDSHPLVEYKPPSMTGTGLVKSVAAHEFKGHADTFLRDNELTRALGGRTVGAQDRPSLLNALAYKCKNTTCLQGQCSLHLNELTLSRARQEFQVEKACNFSESSRLKEAVMPTLLAHYVRPDVEGAKGTFRKVSVEIEAANGSKELIDLCIATWAVVIANMGLGTFEKLRADVPKALSLAESSSIGPMVLFKGDSVDKVTKKDELMDVQDQWKLVKQWLQQKLTTLEHNPTPGACRQIEYIAPRETWENRRLECEKWFREKGVNLRFARLR